MDVHLSSFAKRNIVILTIFTLGPGGLLMWGMTRKWPKRVDSEGVTLRNGKRYVWTDLTKAQPVTVVNERGQRFTGRLDLYFGKKKVSIVPQSLKEDVIGYVNNLLGSDLQSG